MGKIGYNIGKKLAVLERLSALVFYLVVELGECDLDSYIHQM